MKFTLVAGQPGAGKTTYIKDLLAKREAKVKA